MDAEAHREVDAAIVGVLGRIADAIARDAERLAPVDTGELRSRIEVGPVEGRTVRIWSRAEHGIYQELGTRFMAAQPYLRPALYRQRVI